jgi:hypothetical protein
MVLSSGIRVILATLKFSSCVKETNNGNGKSEMQRFFATLRMAKGFGEILAGVEGYEEDSDIVVATLGVGCVDKGLARGAEAGLGGGGWHLGQDGGDVLVGELASQAVGGEQVEVAGLGMVALDVGFDGGLGAYGTGNEVTHGRLGGLLRGDLAGAELLFDEGVIVGELLEIASAEAVTATVSDVNEPKGSWIGGALVGVAIAGGSVEKCDQCGSHAGELR